MNHRNFKEKITVGKRLKNNIKYQKSDEKKKHQSTSTSDVYLNITNDHNNLKTSLTEFKQILTRENNYLLQRAFLTKKLIQFYQDEIQDDYSNLLRNKFDITRNDEKAFTCICLSHDGYGYASSIGMNISNEMLFDKDDYTQMRKEQACMDNIVIDRIDNDIKKIKDKLDEIIHSAIKQIIDDRIINESTYESCLDELQLLIYQIEYYLDLSKQLNEFQIKIISWYDINTSKTMNTLPSKDMENASINKDLKEDNFNKAITNHVQNNIEKYEQVFSYLCSLKIKKQKLLSKLQDFKKIFLSRKKQSSNRNYITKHAFVTINNSSLPLDIHTYYGQTYDRSASAYTAKKRSYRHKSYSSDKVSSNSSRNYMELSDCQAACRRWTTNYRYRKTKLPICYRNFPLSLNALSNQNNIQTSYTNRYSVEVRKVPCNKTSDSFSCSDVGSVDGANGSTLNLKQEHLKNDEENSLYRSVSDNESNLEDIDKEYKKNDDRIIDSFVSIKIEDESSFHSLSNSTLIAVDMLTEENDLDIKINPEILLLDEYESCILYQSPSEITFIVDIIPSCILTLSNFMTTMSIIQLKITPLVISESDIESRWEYKSILNIILNDQQIMLDGDDHNPSNISNDLLDPIDQKYSSRDKEKVDMLNEVVNDPLSSIHESISQKNSSTSDINDNTSMISNNTLDNSELLLLEHAFDLLEPILTENQDSTFIVDDKQDRVFNSNTSNISLISDHINHQSISERKSDKIPELPVKSLISTSSLTKDNRSLTDFEEILLEISQSDDKQSVSILTSSVTNHYPERGETRKILSKNKVAIENEQSITIPTCVHRHDSFEQIINSNSDQILSNTAIPEYLSTSSKHYILQNSDDEYNSPHIDVYQNTESSLKQHSVPSQSKTDSSGSLSLPLMKTSLSTRHLSKQSLESVSMQSDANIQQFNDRKQSNDTSKLSRIMAIPQKIIDDDDVDMTQNQQRHYMKSQFSDFQIEINKIAADQTEVHASSSNLTKRIKRKQKNKSSVTSKKFNNRQKLIRQKQNCIQPPWISSNENRIKNSYTIHKPIHRSSLPLKQLRNPCQILESYIRLKCTHCKPYECICIPTRPCCTISLCPSSRNSHICHAYLRHNNKI